MDDLRPPAAPGRKTKKESFFSKLFKKNIDDVRVTKDSLNEDKLDDIRKKIGIQESNNTQALEEPSSDMELPVSAFQSEGFSEKSFDLPNLESENTDSEKLNSQELDTLENEHEEIFSDMNNTKKIGEKQAPAPEGLPESAPPSDWNPSAEDANHKKEESINTWSLETPDTSENTTSEESWTNVEEPEDADKSATKDKENSWAEGTENTNETVSSWTAVEEPQELSGKDVWNKEPEEVNEGNQEWSVETNSNTANDGAAIDGANNDNADNGAQTAEQEKYFDTFHDDDFLLLAVDPLPR